MSPSVWPNTSTSGWVSPLALPKIRAGGGGGGGGGGPPCVGPNTRSNDERMGYN